MRLKRAPSRYSLDVAYLPGVGWIEEPTPQHYLTAIRWLRERPAWSIRRYGFDSLAEQLTATYRKLLWSQK
jgi:hypothetical protein